jgi:hypothetical protein
MQYSGLLLWWIVSISWSAVFLIVVSIYLYASRSKKLAHGPIGTRIKLSDFVFVFVLAGLLGLYIVSINRSSSVLFATGNMVVEVILIVYTLKNWTRKS